MVTAEMIRKTRPYEMRKEDVFTLKGAIRQSQKLAALIKREHYFRECRGGNVIYHLRVSGVSRADVTWLSATFTSDGSTIKITESHK